MVSPIDPDTELWRLKEVLRHVPLSASRIYRLTAEGRFPAPFRLSERAMVWHATEVREWLAARIAESWTGPAPAHRAKHLAKLAALGG